MRKKKAIRIAVIAEESEVPSVTPKRPQNCFAKIMIKAVATAPSMTAAFMPLFITLLMSL